MGETKKNDVQKKNWFAGLKAEFKKIVWPDKKSLAKQTVAVVVVSVILGADYCSTGSWHSVWR